MVVILERNQLRNILIWLLNLEPEIQMTLYRPYMRDMYIDMNHQPIQFLSEQRNEYYGSNVPLFRRNGYRQSGTMIP